MSAYVEQVVAAVFVFEAVCRFALFILIAVLEGWFVYALISSSVLAAFLLPAAAPNFSAIAHFSTISHLSAISHLSSFPKIRNLFALLLPALFPQILGDLL